MMKLNKDVTKILEWLSTLIVVTGVFLNSLGYYPEGPIIMTIGSIFWIIVGLRWKTPSIIITNSVIFILSSTGLMYTYLA